MDMASQAERLKNQAMTGGEDESRAGGWLQSAIDTLKSYPRQVREYLHEVRIEMHQVTWPSRDQVLSTTFVVIVAVAFFGVFFFGVDSTVGYVLERLFNYFKS
jgi:preprotein translocase subunit SecE